MITVLPPASFIQIVGVFSYPTPIAEVMVTSSTDVRGIDLFAVLSPLGDTVASVSSVLVARTDGLPLTTYDLTTLPPGYAPPWVSVNAAGVPAMAVSWWQQVGTFAQIAPSDCNEVTYLLTVNLITTAGRQLAYVVSQAVAPAAS